MHDGSAQVANVPVFTRNNIRLPYHIFLVGFFCHVLLNFSGTALVSFSYIFCVLLSSFCILFYDWKDSFKVMCLMSLIEGQGRVLFGYNPFFRIFFDLLVTIAIFKSFITNKKFFNFSKMPKFTSILLLLHFLWFSVELFNPDGASFFASFATSKFYILPFLLLFTHLNNPIDLNGSDFRSFLKTLLISLFFLSLLCVYQKSLGSDYMNSLSGNYANLFKKYEIFQGSLFRPWGTSFVPGGFSIFYYLTSGFIMLFYLYRPSSKLGFAKLSPFFLTLYSFLSYFVLFISQVRSAFLKSFLQMALFVASTFLRSGQLFKRLILVFVFVAISLLSITTILKFLPFIDEHLELEQSVTRFSQLSDSGSVSKSRLNTSKVLSIIFEGVEYPLGFGPGMTTSFLPEFQVAREKRKLDIDLSRFWSGDNIIVFFFLELGIGAIFILGCYLSFPFYLFSMALESLKSRSIKDYRVISLALSQTLVIIFGNWGAASIVYNPESFFFMFWVALGFNVFYKEASSKVAH